MKKKLFIFGNSDFATLMTYYFTTESDYTVVGYTVDDEYCTSDTYNDKPLIPFSKFIKDKPPNSCELFIAIGYLKLNKVREDVYNRVSELGYTCANFISKYAIIQNEYNIGTNCAILPSVILGPFSKLGNNNFIFTASTIGHDCILGNHNYIAGGVRFGGFTTLGDNNFLGMGTLIKDKVNIAHKCLVGMGAIITQDIEDKTVIIQKQTEIAPVTTDHFLKFNMKI